MHLSFLTSHNLLFFRFCKTSKKTTFSIFLSFFLVKSPKSQSLKLNISRMAWPILMILVSFCRILNGRSDKINLFWRCSSPLITTTNVTPLLRAQEKIKYDLKLAGSNRDRPSNAYVQATFKKNMNTGLSVLFSCKFL